MTESVDEVNGVIPQASEMAEDIIGALSGKPSSKPFCWIVCYEERPLQGAPQNSREPHLMIFTTKALGKAFIQGRRRYFGPEPLRLVGIDSPATLVKLAMMHAREPRYSTPPCGLLLNFSYETGQPDRALAPTAVAESSAGKIASNLGLKARDEDTVEQFEKTAQPRKNWGKHSDKSRSATGSETEPDDLPNCPLCGELFYMGGSGLSIGFGDEALESLVRKKRATPEHTAYACRKCGTRICRSCATKYRCPHCGNNTFDRFDLAGIEPTPVRKVKLEPAPTPAVPTSPPISAPAIPMPGPAVKGRNPSTWWFVLGGLVFIIILAFLGSRPQQSSRAPEPTLTPVPSVLVNLVKGDDKWTRTDIRRWDRLEIPGRQALSAPEGSKLLIVTFRCTTSKNPLTLLDPNPTLGGNLLTYYQPDGIKDVYLKDDTSLEYPIILIEVFYDGDRPDAFYLVAIVPGNKNTDAYRLYFLDLIPVSLNPTMALYNVTPLGYVPSPTPHNGDSSKPRASTGPEPVILEGGQDFGMEVAFSPKGTYIASGSCDGRVRTWRTNDRKQFMDYRHPESDCVSDIKFSPDESWMAVAFTNQSQVAIFDVASAALLGTLISPEVDELEFSPDKKWLVAGDDGNGNGLRNLSNFPESAPIEKQPPLNKNGGSFFTCLQFNPFSTLLAYGGGSGGVKLWDIKNGKLAQTFITDCRAPESMRFSPDGKYLYFSDGESMSIYVTETGKLYKQVKFAFNVGSISAFSQIMEFVVIPRTEPGKTTLEVWNYWNNQLLTNLTGHTGPVYSLEFSLDGKMLISGGNDFTSGEVFLWYMGSISP